MNSRSGQRMYLLPSIKTLLAIRLDEDSFLEDDGDDNRKVCTWCEWVRNIPLAVNSVKIQGIYKSCSTLVLLRIPLGSLT